MYTKTDQRLSRVYENGAPEVDCRLEENERCYGEWIERGGREAR